MKENNKTCVVCGSKYTYCPTCRQYSSLPPWKTLFDSESCKTIFQTCTDFKMGILSAKQAKSKISKCDLNKEDLFAPNIKSILAEINTSTETTKKSIKSKTSKVSKAEVVEDAEDKEITEIESNEETMKIDE